jgi:hypothetical protein
MRWTPHINDRPGPLPPVCYAFGADVTILAPPRDHHFCLDVQPRGHPGAEAAGGITVVSPGRDPAVKSPGDQKVSGSLRQ